jgi:hypothetical protein
MGRTWKETVVAKSDVTLLIILKQISNPNISAQCYTTSVPREIVSLMHKKFECETLEISCEISRDIFPVTGNTRVFSVR